MQAVRATSPIVIDGVLDEDVWKRAVPSKRIHPGGSAWKAYPATESTEVRVAYDDRPISTSAPSAVTPIRKASSSMTSARILRAAEQDTFEVLLDTFADRRNGFIFSTNAEGARADTQIANEGRDVNPELGRRVVGGRQGRARGLDGRVPHSVQDPALSTPGEAARGVSTSAAASAGRTNPRTGRPCRALIQSFARLPRAPSPGCRRCEKAATCASSRSSPPGRCAASAKADSIATSPPPFVDGSVSINAGCNTMFGGYTVDGDVISVPMLAMTEMACDPR